MSTFVELQRREIEAARSKHRPINSAHEGYSVILEELDEFWEEVRKKRSERSKERMVAELIQIAAMAQRTAEDVCMSRQGCAACDRGDHQIGHAEDCPAKNPSTPADPCSVEELKAVLTEAHAKLIEHHASHLVTWRGTCPVCTQKHTQEWPRDIFGRIYRALRIPTGGSAS